MLYTNLLGAVLEAGVTTPEWSFKVALIMITCNVFAICIGYGAIQKAGKGPAIPGLPGLFTGFGIPELLATTSFGHLLGAGMILGLGNAGLL